MRKIFLFGVLWSHLVCAFPCESVHWIKPTSFSLLGLFALGTVVLEAMSSVYAYQASRNLKKSEHKSALWAGAALDATAATLSLGAIFASFYPYNGAVKSLWMSSVAVFLALGSFLTDSVVFGEESKLDHLNQDLEIAFGTSIGAFVTNIFSVPAFFFIRAFIDEGGPPPPPGLNREPA